MTGALAGLRVVELSQRAAGAFATKLLADLGATVVKVESSSGDPLRRTPVRFNYLNSSKQSAVVGDEAAFAALVAEADVLVDDAEHPWLASISLDARPELVWCSIRPFGLDGPYAQLPAVPLTTFHAGGEGHILPSGLGFTAFPDRAPLQIAPGVVEHDAGATAAIAVLAAVRSGRGQRIDVSDQEAQLTLNRSRLSRYNNDGVVMHRMPSPYPVGGMLQCADGFIQLVGIREEHLAKLAATPEGAVFGESPFATPEDRASDPAALQAALRAWCSTQAKADAARRLSVVGCAVGEFCEPTELLDSPQLAHRQFFQVVEGVRLPGAPYRLSATPAVLKAPAVLGSFAGFPGRAHRSSTKVDNAKPLAGVRIVDFTWAAAGPYATVLLALLGAEVIKVESSKRPDMARFGFLARYPSMEHSPNFNELNLNKQSVCIDLNDERGRDLVDRLVATADVVVDNFRPGVLARLGFAADRLLTAHPRLVVASSSANGATGPDAAGAGLASIFGATGGLSAQTGYPDGPPTEIGESTDYRSANFLAIAILAALEHRDRTGEGQYIDLSSREVVAMLAPEGLLAQLSGEAPPLRRGNTDPAIAPHNVYRCAGDDRWIAIAATDDAMWRELCAAIGDATLAEEHPDVSARLANRVAIDRRIEAFTSGHDVAEVFDRMRTAGVAASPSFTNQDLAGDPHVTARGVFVAIDHPVMGRTTVMRSPWKLSGAPCPPERAGPLMNQDVEAVLNGLLGMTADEIGTYTEVLR
ncbi:MAG: CoA transferase [Acidimicrobiia bacterium]